MSVKSRADQVKLLNCWRVSPFIDIKGFLDRFKQYGLPICLNSTVTSFSGKGPSSYVKISDQPNDYAGISIQASLVFHLITLGLGMPNFYELENTEHNDLINAGLRALQVQKNKMK